MLTEPVLLTRENNTATITFNRPDKMNAFNREMAVCLESVIEEVGQDSSIRIVVLRGAGEVFMAGGDLYEYYKTLDNASIDALAVMRHCNASILALCEMEKPVLACVHGLVTGTGISLMLAADLVIASNTTQFSMGFNRIATSPMGGVSYNLPRIVGNKKALELLFMSENFDVNIALTLGMLNWAVPNEMLEQKTRQIIEYIVNGPTLAFVRTKQLIHSACQNKMSKQLELETEAFVKSVKSRDFKTAVQAFVNKRQPEFEGR